MVIQTFVVYFAGNVDFSPSPPVYCPKVVKKEAVFTDNYWKNSEMIRFYCLACFLNKR